MFRLNIPLSEYLKIDGLSASQLKAGRTSILAMHHSITSEHKQTAAMRMGTLVHTAVLEWERFQREAVVWVGGRRAGKDWEGFCQDNMNRTIITTEENSDISHMKIAVLNCGFASALIDKLTPEVTAVWTDASYGNAKARLDGMINGNDIVELKTTSNLAEFPAQFARMGYDIQMGWYNEGMCKLTGKKRRDVWLIVVETSAPFDVAVWRVPQSVIQAGIEKAVKIASDYRACELTGEYTGVQPRRCVGSDLIMPAWYVGAQDCDLDLIMPMNPSDL